MKELLYEAVLQDKCKDSLGRIIVDAFFRFCMWIFVGAVCMSLIYTTDFIAVDLTRQIIFGVLILIGVGIIICADFENWFLPKINFELAKSQKKWRLK